MDMFTDFLIAFYEFGEMVFGIKYFKEKSPYFKKMNPILFSILFISIIMTLVAITGFIFLHFL